MYFLEIIISELLHSTLYVIYELIYLKDNYCDAQEFLSFFILIVLYGEVAS